MATFIPGNTIRLRVVFVDPTDIAYDPGTITCKVIGPNSRAVQTPAVTRDAVGMYHADYVATDPGNYQWRWEGTSPNSADEGQFTVRQSQFVA